MIPYGFQSIDADDIEAVCEVLRSSWLTTGPKVAEFEQAFAARVGARHAVAVNSGTAALHLGLLAAGIGSGDRVVTTPNTFLASANCAAYTGAIPDFSDVSEIDANLCPDKLLEDWKPDTRALIAVDYAGQTANLPAIHEIAKSNGATVIEDASHAAGGKFEHAGEVWSVGGHPWADMTTFSFHPVKTMTTGEGGMLVTDDDQLAHKARQLRSHGIVRDHQEFVGLGLNEEPEWGPWHHEMHALGYNYRITDFQSALGISQLKRLDSFISRRRELVVQYNAAFANHPRLNIPRLRNPNNADLISWHLYALQVDFCGLGISRKKLMEWLASRGIGTQVHYIPVYLQPWYRNQYGYQPGKCPVAERFYRRAISLPLHPNLSDHDVEYVIEMVFQGLESRICQAA